MDQIDFDGQVVIVTGGGAGLGRAYCRELARRGASVLVNDIDGLSADAVVREIVSAGGRAAASVASVGTPAGGARVVEDALDAYGRLDAVINNAGILRSSPFEELTRDEIDSVIDVNVRGAFHVTQPAWRVLKRQGYGRVVLTSSAAGLFSRPGSVSYSASKAAMYGMARALSFEGAPHDIKVNVVLPRAATAITVGNEVAGPAEGRTAEVSAALAARRAPELSAPLVCWLASRACSVSGEAYSSAYGRYARVFVGLTPGWLADDPAAISVEDVSRELDAIRDVTGYVIPQGNAAEVDHIVGMLGFDTTHLPLARCDESHSPQGTSGV
ncbi:SDR family NAD(P)-dependent oxidoreductase [Jatrophihabitans sp.]|uniref:SDR family NAD(P)-dependent oxidoreductase n=1 Tax=Jatrophihabitans sp. TaxID=1932789 RepID=UPI0030C746AC|nr:short-chain dehydrogenase [Jatrophihabitans sp.]